MDPNETLKIIRRLCRLYLIDDQLDSLDQGQLVELIDALDTWLCNGGMLPNAWDAASHKN